MAKDLRKQLEALARPVFRAYGEGYCTGVYLNIGYIAGKWDFNAVALRRLEFESAVNCTGTIYIPEGDGIELVIPRGCPVNIVRLDLHALLKKAQELK